MRWNPTRCPSSGLGTFPFSGSGWLCPGRIGRSRKIGDDAFNEIFHPIATRLLEKCDAVLRVGGPSTGADEMVRVGRSLGLKIYSTLAVIPGVE
jgi:hypothetical protein